MGFTASCFSLTRIATKEPDNPSLICTGQELSPCCNLQNTISIVIIISIVIDINPLMMVIIS